MISLVFSAATFLVGVAIVVLVGMALEHEKYRGRVK
jgi:hypothetical protein